MHNGIGLVSLPILLSLEQVEKRWGNQFIITKAYTGTFFLSLSLYTASRLHGYSRQVGAVLLKEEGKYRQKNKEGIVRG